MCDGVSRSAKNGAEYQCACRLSRWILPKLWRFSRSLGIRDTLQLLPASGVK